MLVVLTHLDEVDKLTKDNPQKILDSSVVADVINSVCSQTDIQPEAIRVMLPYHLGGKIHPVKSYLMLSLVKEILDHGANFISNNSGQDKNASGKQGQQNVRFLFSLSFVATTDCNF